MKGQVFPTDAAHFYPFKGFDNEVVERKIESILLTKMDMNRYMTADYQLAENEGMKKVIRTYQGSGEAEDLARGDGLENYIDAEYIDREYVVSRTQAGCKFYDDDALTDSMLVDTKVKTVAEVMLNDWTKKAIAEFEKTNNQSVMTNYDLADFADAIAKYSNVFEDQAGLFFLASQDMIPQIRKSLGDYLKYTEGYIRTGAIGEILGVPIYTSKALPKKMMFLAHKDAVHAFMKKNVFVESDRDIDHKENRMIAARYTVIALYDERKCIACGKEQTAVPATITTKAAGAAIVAGAAKTGAKVTCFVNGKQFGVPVVAAANAYSITGAENLVAGDKIVVRAEVEEFLPSIAKDVAA